MSFCSSQRASFALKSSRETKSQTRKPSSWIFFAHFPLGKSENRLNSECFSNSRFFFLINWAELLSPSCCWYQIQIFMNVDSFSCRILNPPPLSAAKWEIWSFKLLKGPFMHRRRIGIRPQLGGWIAVDFNDKQMEPVVANGRVHTGRKQHQMNCPQICVLASSVNWASQKPESETL